jgi:uncharacterized Zn-binding protein involved in type VI secretion
MPAVTRIGDADVPHCTPMTRLGCSPNVFAEGKLISRQSDVNTPHLRPPPVPPCPGCGAPITTGSTTVFINNLGCGRVGDGITACTSVAQGAGTVFAN